MIRAGASLIAGLLLLGACSSNSPQAERTVPAAVKTGTVAQGHRDFAGNRMLLELVNQARAHARQCGDQHFDSAPPLNWNSRLAAAADAHNHDMYRNRFLSHAGSDGGQVWDRVERVNYHWRAVGENIASGQVSESEAVHGWLGSAEHCANLMDPAYREMGSAYIIDPEHRFRSLWTQVLAAPR